MRAVTEEQVQAEPDEEPDAHRPEAAPLPEHRRPRPALVLVLLAVLGCGLVTVVVDAVAGVMALAGVLAVLGVARLVLPARLLDGLIVRARGIDVATAWILAAGLTALAQSAPNL